MSENTPSFDQNGQTIQGSQTNIGQSAGGTFSGNIGTVNYYQGN